MYLAHFSGFPNRAWPKRCGHLQSFIRSATRRASALQRPGCPHFDGTAGLLFDNSRDLRTEHAVLEQEVSDVRVILMLDD